MNYQRIYDSIIYRARVRKIDGYTELHHVLPRCLGGSDDHSNLVRLTPEEHYLCHLVLLKIYPNEHKLVFAARMMCANNQNLKRNNKLYGWLRRKYSKEMKLFKNTPEQKLLISKTWKQIYSDHPELREIASKRMKVDNPMKREGVALKVSNTRRERGNLGRNSTPVSEEEKIALSVRMKANNPCAGLPPWMNNRATPEALNVWKQADSYYEWWKSNQKGYCAMATAFGYKNWMSAHDNMVTKFKSGWIPKQDPQWLSFVGL